MATKLDGPRIAIYVAEKQLYALWRQAKGARRKRLEGALLKANLARAALHGMR